MRPTGRNAYNLCIHAHHPFPFLHHRLCKTKAALLAASLTLADILLMMLNAWVTPLRLGDW